MAGFTKFTFDDSHRLIVQSTTANGFRKVGSEQARFFAACLNLAANILRHFAETINKFLVRHQFFGHEPCNH